MLYARCPFFVTIAEATHRVESPRPEFGRERWRIQDLARALRRALHTTYNIQRARSRSCASAAPCAAYNIQHTTRTFKILRERCGVRCIQHTTYNARVQDLARALRRATQPQHTAAAFPPAMTDGREPCCDQCLTERDQRRCSAAASTHYVRQCSAPQRVRATVALHGSHADCTAAAVLRVLGLRLSTRRSIPLRGAHCDCLWPMAKLRKSARGRARLCVQDSQHRPLHCAALAVCRVSTVNVRWADCTTGALSLPAR